MVVRQLGRVPYLDGWESQRRLVDERGRGAGADTLLVCEHEPVITAGRGTSGDFLGDFLNERRFDVVEALPMTETGKVRRWSPSGDAPKS